MSEQPNRRDVLKAAAVAGVGYWVSGSPARAESKSANERLNVASIGVGGKGHSDVQNASKCGCNVVALCDVDEKNGAANFKAFPQAKKFNDFREMFDKMAKDIDVVTVSTPDHTHAVATMMAMKLGKHVYTQKPLTHDVYEARMLTQAAKETGVCTQMGNQGTALPGSRTAIETIWGGGIGTVREVHVWTNRPVWPQGTNAILGLPPVKYALHRQGDATPAIPETLKWDLWLGTAPERPFPGYATIQPFNWRGWWDYGTGALGDMACHTANMAFRSCSLGYPTSVEAEVSEYNPETAPMWSVVRYEFPEREGHGGQKLPPLKWTWYDGGKDKPKWVIKKLKELAQGEKLSDSGSLIMGDKGTLFSPSDYGAEYTLLPRKDFLDYKAPAPTLPRIPEEWKTLGDNGHMMEFINAIKQGKPELAMSNFSYAGPLTETVVLGCVAIRAQKRIEWDGPNMKITNDEAANKLLKRDYRKGWSL
jgi:predicted dehydrogenase